MFKIPPNSLLNSVCEKILLLLNENKDGLMCKELYEYFIKKPKIRIQSRIQFLRSNYYINVKDNSYCRDKVYVITSKGLTYVKKHLKGVKFNTYI